MSGGGVSVYLIALLPKNYNSATTLICVPDAEGLDPASRFGLRMWYIYVTRWRIVHDSRFGPRMFSSGFLRSEVRTSSAGSGLHRQGSEFQPKIQTSRAICSIFFASKYVFALRGSNPLLIILTYSEYILNMCTVTSLF